MSLRPTVLAVAAVLTTTACESFTAVLGPTHYSAALTGANVKPSAVTTQASGTTTMSYDPVARTLSYTLGVTRLSGTATSVHLHGPASDAAIGSLLIDFDDLPAGSTGTITFEEASVSATGSIGLSGAITPTVSGDSLLTLLQRGQLYVDVHTAANAGGEVRGQLREN